MIFNFIFLCEIYTTSNLSISRAMSGEACQEVVTHTASLVVHFLTKERYMLMEKGDIPCDSHRSSFCMSEFKPNKIKAELSQHLKTVESSYCSGIRVEHPAQP